MSTMKTIKHVKSSWVSKSKIDEMPWGHEVVWSALPSVRGKILYMKEGSRNSLKINVLKDECLFVLTGTVEAEYGTELSLEDPVQHPFESRVLSPGDTLNVQSGCPYRLTAITDVKIVEIGNSSNSNRQEVVRIEDDYGRE